MTQARSESPRFWRLAIIGCGLALLLGIGIFVLSGFQGPLGGQILGLIGSVMIVSGFCFGIASIIILRNFHLNRSAVQQDIK